ncbi:MAG: hypothetical protein EOM28_07750 [Clostridia bacterium]|nr:hypothetical protein [Clostridia bacterium]
MWTTEVLGFPFFELYAFFIIYSFLGWALESLFVSVSNGTWVNRGFISGPFCPIYGTGAVLVIVGLTPALENTLWLFCGGVAIATIVEYVISFLLEKIFHATWWDYSQMRFNLKGRICLLRSLEWGGLTVIMMRIVQPPIQRFVQWIPSAIGEFVGVLLLIYLISDASVTVMNIFQMKEKMARLGEATLALREKMESVKLFDAKKELLDYFETLPMAEAMVKLKEKMEERSEQMMQFKAEEQLRFEYILSEMKEKLESRDGILKKNNITERRLTRAFPRLSFKKYNEEFAVFKREISNKKKIEKKKGYRK